MNLFEILLFNTILLAFPYILYLFYIYSNETITENEKTSFFYLAIVSSCFLILRFSNQAGSSLLFLLLNIPIFLGYLQHKAKITFIFSLFLWIIDCYLFDVSLIIGIDYILFYLLSRLRDKYELPDDNFLFLFCLIVIISFIYVIILYPNHGLDILLQMVIFLTILTIIYSMFIKCEEIMSTHVANKKLRQNEQIQLSLFKITHEIKNPIAVCKAYLDMMDPNNLEQVQKYVPIINNEIERLLLLLQDFLLVNKSNLQYDIMDVNLLLEDVIDNVSGVLDTKQINLHLESDQDEILINGDYNRLMQVMVNLVKNSVEASSRDIKISSDIKNNYVEIIVSDDGSGIAQNILKRIREPFYTTKANGTGLGVSLSYEIIQAHEGKIEYQSELGIGTSVKVLLPVYNL